MAAATATALIGSALIGAGSQAIQGSKQRRLARRQQADRKKLEDETRRAEVSNRETQKEIAAGQRRVTRAAADEIRGRQLLEKGISSELSVDALGRTPDNTAAATLNPIRPDRNTLRI